jgi:GNAT superfamily N-acetyltransferase
LADVEVIRLTGDDWCLLRDVRLAALADAPYAYGSNLAREQAFDEAEWRRRAGEGRWVVAVDDGEPAGMVGIYAPARDTPMVVGMWVNPGHRGRGIGDQLLAEVIRWAADNRWSDLVLRVADGNDAARGLFLRHGFTPTGCREPLESDPTVGTEMLVRAI